MVSNTVTFNKPKLHSKIGILAINCHQAEQATLNLELKILQPLFSFLKNFLMIRLIIEPPVGAIRRQAVKTLLPRLKFNKCAHPRVDYLTRKQYNCIYSLRFANIHCNLYHNEY